MFAALLGILLDLLAFSGPGRCSHMYWGVECGAFWWHFGGAHSYTKTEWWGSEWWVMKLYGTYLAIGGILRVGFFFFIYYLKKIKWFKEIKMQLYGLFWLWGSRVQLLEEGGGLWWLLALQQPSASVVSIIAEGDWLSVTYSNLAP